MQINRRDYIEFQLEESNGRVVVGGGVAGAGGAGIAGNGGLGSIIDDTKLDYRVTMAIEKNTQLVSVQCCILVQLRGIE